MKYINQLEHEEIPYPTDIETPNSEFQKGNIKIAGCGLCSLCMVVDHLTLDELPLQDCIDLSCKLGANHGVGTDMRIIGPAVAERYHLGYRETDRIADAEDCLSRGGRVIANVGGDRDDGNYQGVFSHGGHFITLIASNQGEICVLDPSWRSDKFEEPGRPGKVRLDGKLVYCSSDILDRDADNRSPRYYLFWRK